MIGVAMYTTIKTLWKKHKNKALIAKLTGHDWKTVAKRIREIEEEKEYQAKKPHPRILDPYHEQILQWLEEDLSGVRIHEKIQQKGVQAGYSTVKDLNLPRFTGQLDKTIIKHNWRFKDYGE